MDWQRESELMRAHGLTHYNASGYDKIHRAPYISVQGRDLHAAIGHLYGKAMRVTVPFTRFKWVILPSMVDGYWVRLFAYADDSDCFKGGPMHTERVNRIAREMRQ